MLIDNQQVSVVSKQVIKEIKNKIFLIKVSKKLKAVFYFKSAMTQQPQRQSA